MEDDSEGKNPHVLYKGEPRCPRRLWLRDIGPDSDVSSHTEDTEGDLTVSDSEAAKHKNGAATEGAKQWNPKKRTKYTAGKQKGIYQSITQEDPGKFMEEARKMAMDMDKQNLDMPNDYLVALKTSAGCPVEHAEIRRKNLAYWAERKEALQHQPREKFYDQEHPALEKIMKMDLPLLDEMLRECGCGGGRTS